jgi:hypothetical protein
MKQINIIEESKTLSDEQWDNLFASMREYNKYVDLKTKAILDFDVWFEHSNSMDFPKEWYSMIRKNSEDK